MIRVSGHILYTCVEACDFPVNSDSISTLIDSHCHLDLNQFAADRAAVVARAQARGVRMIVNPGIDRFHCRQAIALADLYSHVYAAVGIHPNSSFELYASDCNLPAGTASQGQGSNGGCNEQTLTELRQLAAHPKVVAIGEIGLDYYWDKVPRQRQMQAFRAQLLLAADLGLPVMIHNRDASADVAEILDEWATSAHTRNSSIATRPFWGVLHAFNGDAALAQRAYGWNFVLGLGGPVTFKNAHNLHELIPNLRLDRLVLETDAPYLTPHPFRGKRNEPAYVALVAERLAELFAVPVQEIAARTTATACSLFGIGGE